MKYSQKDFENYETISRSLFWFPITLGICSAVLSTVDISWVNLISAAMFIFVLFLVLISMITPCVLLILGKPWLAQAWLRGINSLIIPKTYWGDLSVGKKIMVYFYSISGFSFAILAVIAFVMNKGY